MHPQRVIVASAASATRGSGQTLPLACVSAATCKVLKPAACSGGEDAWSVAPYLLGRESGDCVRFVLPLPAARLPTLQRHAEAQGTRRSCCTHT